MPHDPDDPARVGGIAPSQTGQSWWPSKATTRRLKRRLKAGLSIGIAVVAGTFLACKSQFKGRDRPAPIPPADAAPAKSSPPTDAKLLDAGSHRDAKPAVDKEQHRKGMPVPDNLLE